MNLKFNKSINSVHSLFRQQLGFERWARYDEVLSRFTCSKDDEFDCIYGRDNGNNNLAETPIFACKFSQSEGYENLLALANESGSVIVVNTEKKPYTRSGGSSHNNAIFDIAWVPKSLKLFTASGDHSAALLDLSHGDFRVEKVFVGHGRSLKTVACCEQDPNIFATGGRDGKINVWDFRTGIPHSAIVRPGFSIPYSHVQYTRQKNLFKSKSYQISAANSVTGLIFQNSTTLFSCGAGDGAIKAWDMRRVHYGKNHAPVSKWVLPYSGNTLKNGYSHLVIDYKSNILYASCLDNSIYAYNINTYNPKPIMEYTQHKNRTYYVKMCLSGDGNYILSGSSDNYAYIWHKSLSTPLVRLVGHEAEVTGVGWNTCNSGLLVTCSDDLKHKFWTISDKVLSEGEQVEETVGYTEKVPPPSKSVVTISFDDKDVRDVAVEPKEFKNLCYAVGNNSNVSLMHDVIEQNSSKKRPLETEDTLDLNAPSTSRMCSNNNADLSHSTAKKLKLDDVGTLLDNLPNFLDYGEAPHLNISPVKLPEMDWLTKLRCQLARSSKIRMLSGPPTLSQSIPDKVAPFPKINESQSSGSSRSISNSPLLKYFKVVNRRTASVIKSSSISLLSTPPEPSD